MDEHGASGSGRCSFQPAAAGGHNDRRISVYGEIEKCRNHRKGDEQNHGSGPAERFRHSHRNIARIYIERERACPTGICIDEHSFSEGHERLAEGGIPSEIRGTFLPPAFAPETEIHQKPERARHTDAESRRRVQYLLQCIAVQPDGGAKAGDKGDPRRHDEREADEQAAPG